MYRFCSPAVGKVNKKNKKNHYHNDLLWNIFYIGVEILLQILE